jgi:hypothetical protein
VFTRAVLINVKAGCEVELARTFEQEVIPRFRKEKDFRGLLAFTVPDGTEALSLSLWDQKESRGGIWARCFGALMTLAKVVLGIPSVQTYEVSNSALHTMERKRTKGKQLRRIRILKSISLRFGLSNCRPHGKREDEFTR